MKIVIYPSNSSDLHHTGYTVLHIGKLSKSLHKRSLSSASSDSDTLPQAPPALHFPSLGGSIRQYRLRYLPIQGRSLSAYPRKQNAVLSIHPALSSGPLVSIPGLLLITRTLRKRRCKTSWSSSTSPALLVVGLEIQD